MSHRGTLPTEGHPLKQSPVGTLGRQVYSAPERGLLGLRNQGQLAFWAPITQPEWVQFLPWFMVASPFSLVGAPLFCVGHPSSAVKRWGVGILKNSDRQLFLCGQEGAGKSRSVKGPSDEALEHLLMGSEIPGAGSRGVLQQDTPSHTQK